MDVGNVDQLARRFGQDPFEEPIYNGGGNRKASDGPVLGEHIARQLGANLRRNTLANLRTLPGLTLGGFGSAQLRTYAYAGALSGSSGSARSGLGAFPLGLRSQARAVATSTLLPERDLDALTAAGSNDLIDLVEQGARLRRVLASPGRRDDRGLQQRTAKAIVGNIRASRDAITGVVDETVTVGLSPLSATPYLQQQASSGAGGWLIHCSIGWMGRPSGSIGGWPRRSMTRRPSWLSMARRPGTRWPTRCSWMRFTPPARPRVAWPRRLLPRLRPPLSRATAFEVTWRYVEDPPDSPAQG